MTDHVVKSLSDLNNFIEKADEGLMQQVKEDDYDGLVKGQIISEWIFLQAKILTNFYSKGQIKSQADWRAVDFPINQMNQFGFFCFTFTVQKYLKLETWTQNFNFQVFPGLSWQKTPKFVSLFLGRIYATPICFRFYLTFST